MIEMEINKVLGQMRALSGELQSRPQPQPAGQSGASVDFGQLLRQSIGQVNEQQSVATNLLTQFESGAADVSVAEVMVSMQKAVEALTHEVRFPNGTASNHRMISQK